MFFKTRLDERRRRDAAAATAVAHHVGWSTERPLILPACVADVYRWVPGAELLLGPIGDVTPSQGLEAAMRLARVDCLTIGIGGPVVYPMNVFAVVGLWGRQEITWHAELRAWCASNGELWVAPEAHRDDGKVPAFRLTSARLAPSAAPWASLTERAVGFARADHRIFSEVAR
jgi:hypothetical protein